MMGQKDEHIIKMWTPLKFTTPEDYDFFPENLLFRGLNLFLRGLVYTVIPVILKVFLGLRVVGGEKLKDLPKKGITVCNHVHVLDCGVIACHMNRRRLCMPTLESNFRIPFIRHLIRALGAVPLPEQVKPFRAMNQALADHIAKGHLVHVYPEAVLYPGYNGLRNFKRGAFVLAYDCNVPVIPYVIRYVKPEGLQKLFHRKKVMRLYILDPVYPHTDSPKREETKRLCEETWQKMNAVFEEK